MSQHAVLYSARSTSHEIEKLMHAAGLHTHPGVAPSTEKDTIEPLVKEFGNLFDPEFRRQIFESEVCLVFICNIINIF
jgi:hypothetical protein